MFRYRYPCRNKDGFLDRIEYMKSRDLPCGKGLFGKDLYDAGIHFTECGEKVKGFFLKDNEDPVLRGAHNGRAVRVWFSGKFTEENGDTYFDVFIYPEIFATVILLVLFFEFCFSGKIEAVIIATVVLLFFGKGFCDMMLGTKQVFDEMLK